LRSLKRRATQGAIDRLHIPPPRYCVFTLPGVAPLVRARWALTVRRAPVMTVEEHAAATGMGELEEIVGCALCGERRVRALFYVRPGREARRRYHVVLCAGCEEPGRVSVADGLLLGENRSTLRRGGGGSGRSSPGSPRRW
jgi:hypothetical protein